MPVDYGRLKTTLSNSKMQVENNALHQTVLGLIDGVKTNQQEAQAAIDSINTILSTLNQINVIEVDTTFGPVTYDLVNITNMALIKDVNGNAGANAITLLGTVEGVVNPTINTNFGIYRVYKGITDGGLFHTW